MPDHGSGVTDRARALRLIYQDARAESSSEDHAVKVVVGPGGAVIDIEVTNRAARLTAEEIGRLIVEQLDAANTALTRELSERTAALLGGAAPRSYAPSTLPTVEELRGESGAGGAP